MKLQKWLRMEQGRGVEFSRVLGLTKDAVSKASRYPTGVPDSWHQAVHEHTGGMVGYLDMLSDKNRVEVIRRHKYIGAEIAQMKKEAA